MIELKAIIDKRIEDELFEIRAKMQYNVPMQFVSPHQDVIFTLQWVLEQIENLENEAISRQNT